jgi:hypothetical protein
MDWIVIEGMRPYDGRYELGLDDAPLTIREWGWIKRHAGYLPIGLDETTFADPEVITILALIAMRRAGKITTAQVGEVWDRFADAPFGAAITFDSDGAAEEDDAGPPAGSSNGNASTSGDSSTTGSASSGLPPSPTGSPASATSVSAPATSVS